jgi:hypothetical protein
MRLCQFNAEAVRHQHIQHAARGIPAVGLKTIMVRAHLRGKTAIRGLED